AAGYVIYGSSAILVYSDGADVFGFTLDPQVGEFFLSHPNIRIPEHGDTYSINEGNRHKWRDGVRAWVDWIKTPDAAHGHPYGLRYSGAMVADFHRTLLRGGVFAYPGDTQRAEGKLRLLYECAPLSFIAEAAGGRAIDERGAPILDIVPTKLHQRTPLFIGSAKDVEALVPFLGRAG
ncbi:MAG: fructose-1,6-bisphosphatase, partial [Myxococcales bacterium]|nr:fructose-1,6-bisphosphatase [Myxococcales bacterium]